MESYPKRPSGMHVPDEPLMLHCQQHSNECAEHLLTKELQIFVQLIWSFTMFQPHKMTAILFAAFASFAGCSISAGALAADTVATASSTPALQLASLGDDWSVHGQLTYVNQWHPDFTAPYSGPNSMDSAARNTNTTDITLFLGRRLWKGAELWLNPEIDQGFGLSNTVGMAGFPSGEAYKIGENRPYIRLPRAFVRHVIPLDGETQAVEDGINQFANSYSANNVVITVGKFSVVDIFDNNSYAHDARSDFLNWSIIDSGTFDYAADSWGFTNGAVAEWNQNNWSLRGGAFQMSQVPNQKVTGFHFHQHSFVAELEHRHEWAGHPGKVKVLAFVNRGDMGDYRDATSLALATNATPDTALVRRNSSNPGLTLNFEQELTSDLGVFARAGINSGKKEAYEFTDINRSISGGLSLQGARWGRPNDKIGIAGAVNALSSDAKAYFSAGGIDILIGDGQLNYGTEKIIEAYYSAALTKNLKLSLDYQHVTNPAYNRDRGPFSIYAVRLHAEL